MHCTPAAAYVYYCILIPHVLLAATVPVLAVLTIYFGLSDQRVRHRRIARWTFPIWLYVSVTGVLVYLMLYASLPSPIVRAIMRFVTTCSEVRFMSLPRVPFRSRVFGAMTICVAVIVALSAEVASACPSCKAALANQGKGDLVKGFMYSILFMLSMPFALLGSFSGYMYVLVRPHVGNKRVSTRTQRKRSSAVS